MSRETSIAAWREIKANGLLSLRRWQVYNALFQWGPLTAQGVYEVLVEQEKLSTRRNQFNVTSRLSELVKIGVARELDTVTCPRSGMQVMRWEVTDKLPRKMPKEKRTKCQHCNGNGYTAQLELGVGKQKRKRGGS